MIGIVGDLPARNDGVVHHDGMERQIIKKLHDGYSVL
jgi:hypothetical protein